jgi:hypothetical protein
MSVALVLISACGADTMLGPEVEADGLRYTATIEARGSPPAQFTGGQLVADTIVLSPP